jgi:hypothetical protein
MVAVVATAHAEIKPIDPLGMESAPATGPSWQQQVDNGS